MSAIDNDAPTPQSLILGRIDKSGYAWNEQLSPRIRPPNPPSEANPCSIVFEPAPPVVVENDQPIRSFGLTWAVDPRVLGSDELRKFKALVRVSPWESGNDYQVQVYGPFRSFEVYPGASVKTGFRVKIDPLKLAGGYTVEARIYHDSKNDKEFVNSGCIGRALGVPIAVMESSTLLGMRFGDNQDGNLGPHGAAWMVYFRHRAVGEPYLRSAEVAVNWYKSRGVFPMP